MDSCKLPPASASTVSSRVEVLENVEATPIPDIGRSHLQYVGVGSYSSISAVKVQCNMTSSTSIESEESSEDPLAHRPTPKVSIESIELRMCENEWLGKCKQIRDASKDWLAKVTEIRNASNQSPPVLNNLEEVADNMEDSPLRIINCGKMYSPGNHGVPESFESTNAIRCKATTSMTSEESADSLGKHLRLETLIKDYDESVSSDRIVEDEKQSKAGEASGNRIVKNVQMCMEGLNIQHTCTAPDAKTESILQTIISDFFTREEEINVIRKKYNMERKREAEPRIPKFITVVNKNANMVCVDNQSSGTRKSSRRNKAPAVASHFFYGTEASRRNKNSTTKRSAVNGSIGKLKSNSNQRPPKNASTKIRMNVNKSHVDKEEDVFTRLYNQRKHAYPGRIGKTNKGPVREPFEIYSQPKTSSRKEPKGRTHRHTKPNVRKSMRSK